MTIDERYMSRKFLLTTATLVASVPCARWLTPAQWEQWSTLVIQVLSIYMIGNVATKVATK